VKDLGKTTFGISMNIVTFLMVPSPLCIFEKRRKRPWKDDFWKFKELRYPPPLLASFKKRMVFFKW
jgi:hypothetical protein